MRSKKTSLKKLTSTSAIYLVGGTVQQAAGFLLLPVYTNFLSTADYGVLEILTSTGLVSLALLNLGLPSAITKCYHRDCNSEADRKAILPTSLVVGFPTLLVGCFFLFWASTWLSYLLLGNAEMHKLVSLLSLWVLLNGISGVILALFRARQEAFIYAALGLSALILLLTLNIWFIVVMKLGVEGILWGNILSNACLIAVSIPLLKGKVRPDIKVPLLKPLLAFGLLMIPTALAGWVMGLSDRYFLQYFGQMSDVGIYSLGYKCGMVLEILVVSPFQLAWPPFSFSISNEENHRRVYARTLTYLLVISTFGVLTLSLMILPLLQLVAHQDYIGAYKVVPLIAVAYWFNGIRYCVAPGIHIQRKTKYMPLLLVGSAIVNIALNVLWIPRFGMMGAAWATTVSFAILAIATLSLSNAVYPIKYEYRRIAKVILVGTILYALGSLFQSSSFFTMMAACIAIILSFPLTLLIFRFLAPDEKEILLKTFRGLREKLDFL